MKKWYKILIAALLVLGIAAGRPSTAKADTEDISITGGKGAAEVVLHPLGEASEAVSLLLNIEVLITEGNVDKATVNFTFNQELSSSVQEFYYDAVSGMLHLYVAGTENIFSEGNDAKLGTIDIMTTDTDGCTATIVPFGYEVINKADGRTVIDVAHYQEVTVDGGFVEPEPEPSPSPEPAPNPGGDPQPQPTPEPTPVPDVTPTPEPTPTPAPAVKPGKTTLKTSVKNGGNRITFSWKKPANADGYQIYQYDASQKKYVRVKTILDGNVTSYTGKKLAYGKIYRFKIRAFSLDAEGERLYGSFSKVIYARTAPAKVSSAAKAVNGKTIKISWKKVEKADGYQIYRSTSKNGKYVRVKTIANGKALSYQQSKLKKGTYYYKVRAYSKKADGSRIYGAFSNIKSAKIK